MNRVLVLILIISLFCLFSCKSALKDGQESDVKGFDVTNEIKVYDFNSFEKLLYTKSDTTYVVNFWAMWCAPCVKELPYFIELANKNRANKIELLFVSLDFTEDIDSKLKPFLQKLNMRSKVVLLDEANANSWIDRVNPNWSGSIPFTIIFNKENRVFYEQEFESLEELENEINKIK